MSNLMGWNSFWYSFTQNENDNHIFRIIQQHRNYFVAVNKIGEKRNIYIKQQLNETTALGDWCIVENEFIDESNTKSSFVKKVLPRKSHITRARSGFDEHILIANLDTLFIVTSCNEDFNMNRLKRYLLLAKSGGVSAKVVLSKTDLVNEAELNQYILWTQKAVERERIVVLDDFNNLTNCLYTNETYAFVGSSGVGKSTIVNRLLGGDIQTTQAIREDDAKGRHTTSAGQIFLTNSGVMIADTPGLRAVEVIADVSDVDYVFEEISHYSGLCKFRDCTHTTEPNCAIKNRIEQGLIEPSYIEQYHKLKRQALRSAKVIKQKQKSKKKNIVALKKLSKQFIYDDD